MLALKLIHACKGSRPTILYKWNVCHCCHKGIQLFFSLHLLSTEQKLKNASDQEVKSWKPKYLLIVIHDQGLTLSIWFTCPLGTFKKFTCPAKIFMCPANICTSRVRLMHTAGKISKCPGSPTPGAQPEIYLPCRARNHKSLCALGQDLHAPGMP